MSVDAATVRRIAHLARIAVTEQDVPHLQGELNAILAFVEQLDEVDVAGVEPMTSVTPMVMKKREDRVTDGEMAERIVANAPESEDNYFLVPKVVE
jgi:aspartyl-tRNA(Asn)/glutamyl-tRNA(Gln) amidotransferase subunit C